MSRATTTDIEEGEYSEFKSPLSTIGVCVGIGSGMLEEPYMLHAHEHRHPGVSAFSHFTSLGYVVKAVSMTVSLPRLRTAKVSLIWQMTP